MIREHGSPSLFLMLSCAEYESFEISAYLHKVNNVPEKYPIGKLCTEDPISVTHKFEQKFYDFLNIIIVKGKVLGKVAHYFVKKSIRLEEHHITINFVIVNQWCSSNWQKF